MYNEKLRKITSLTLMTVMLAGGMTIALPGMEPAYAAGNLSVSAESVGNFAGIQVIEIVVNDPNRSDTSESQGIPNVEINGDDVLMAQADDGAWYGYVANDIAITSYEVPVGNDITEIYGEASETGTPFSGSNAKNTFISTPQFLDGFKSLSGTQSAGSSQASGTVTISSVTGEADATGTAIATTTTGEEDATGTVTATATTGEVDATGTVTLVTVADTETVTVNTLVYTGVTGVASDNTEFSIDGDNTADATALVAAITSRDAAAVIADNTAGTSNVVDITAVVGGTGGNAFTLATTSGSSSVSGATLAGGIDGDTIEINSLVYTAVVGTAADNTEFDVGTGNADTADNLAPQVLARDGAAVNAVSDGTDTVTITAIVGGTGGNAFTLAQVGGGFTVSAGTLAGGVDGDTIEINSLVYTAVVGTAADNTEFDVGAGNADTADNLAPQVLARDGAAVNAVSDGTDTVTITALVGGTGGNAFTLVQVGGGFTVSGATLTGGVNGDTVTINSLLYTSVVGTAADTTEFSIDGSDQAGAGSLATQVSTRDAAVTAASGGTSTVTITAVVVGVAGNGIALAESTAGARITISGALLTGGTDGTISFDNNPALDDTDWPFIQTYDISDNSQVTITYGTGSTSETVTLTYDYDDDKDISLDRQNYPVDAAIFITLDDSLLNLSPTGDDYWSFNEDETVDYRVGTIVKTGIDYANVGFEEGPLTFDLELGSAVYVLQDTAIFSGLTESSGFVLLRESNDDDNIFVNYDRADKSNVIAKNTGSSSFAYNDAHSVILDTFNGAISFVGPAVEEWFAGIELTLSLTDEDRNLNSQIDEDILILGGEVPFIELGEPITITDVTITDTSDVTVTATLPTKSETATLTLPGGDTSFKVTVPWPTGYGASMDATPTEIFGYVNYDFTKFGGDSGTFFVGTRSSGDGDIPASGVTDTSDTTNANFEFTGLTAGTDAAYFDILFFGQQAAISTGDGTITENIERVNDAFYRFELEETDDNTATYEGTVEYIMINQLNVASQNTYDGIKTSGDDVVIIVNDDLDGADAVRATYQDIDSTSSIELISVQEDANTHSGKISLDKPTYSSGNTIVVTLDDSDLNTNSDTIQSYVVDPTNNWIGNGDVWLVQMLINDIVYDNACGATPNLDLEATGFDLVETSKDSGLFVGTLKLPQQYCLSGNPTSTNGVDVEFEYQDYSDASGKPNETSTSSSITSNTGSVSFDRTVYPLPFDLGDFPEYDKVVGSADSLPKSDVKIVIQVDDQDANLSANGEDTLDSSFLKLEITRGSLTQPIDIPATEKLVETDPESGIFEIEVFIPQQQYPGLLGLLTDVLTTDIINQGDIITIEYEDQNDASGSKNTVTDSATFDLRNGVLQTDKSVYIIGGDAIVTVIEPDLNLDSETAETWSLDLINWDSDAGDTNLSDNIFDAQPSGLRETGDNTGIFQVVIEIPRDIGGDKLERGEQITLEYQDWGPAGADFVGDDNEDIELNIFTSNFGATITLDQKVYTWTDKVYVTIVAPDHNFDNDTIDEIGVDKDSQINISTRSDELEQYKFVETGSDTGIFTAEIILIGDSAIDADGDGTSPDVEGKTGTGGSGPTSGRISTSSDDGLTVSFEFSDNEVVLGSALIRWNIGEVQWLEASYPASGTGVIRVIDPDMNWNPESVDSFDVDVWSDTAAGGINLRVTETNEATGIFEGTVSFTVTDASSGSRLAVSEGDTVTAEYEDNTLPDPYSTADELDITATTLIGTIVPPLERAPAGNLRAVDAFGNSLSTVAVDQQVQVTADIQNGQDRDQEFAYLLQVQDENGVTVSLSWITGTLQPAQSFSPAVSWIPEQFGDYTATVFVWQSVDNPTALSPPISTTIKVNN